MKNCSTQKLYDFKEGKIWCTFFVNFEIFKIIFISLGPYDLFHYESKENMKFQVEKYQAT